MVKSFFTLLALFLSSCQHPNGIPKTAASSSKLRTPNPKHALQPSIAWTPSYTPYGDDQYATYLQRRFSRYLGAFPLASSQQRPPLSLLDDIPASLRPEVQKWIHYFQTKAKRSVHQWLTRGDAIESTMIPILIAHDMPSELFYVAMIESGFNNHACSPRQAGGPWQLIGATARLHGLEMTHWVDERLDPVKSTLAAVVYWKKLYRQFGNWYLAIAAYNSGPRVIQEVLRKTTPEKFWAYSKGKISKETREFVPKAIAAILIGTNPEAYGIRVEKDPSLAFPLHYAYFPTPTSLPQISRDYGIPLAKLRYWNPELLHGKTPPQPPFLLPGYPVRLPQQIIQTSSLPLVGKQTTRRDLPLLQLFKTL